MEGFYDSAVVQGVTALIRSVGPFVAPPVLLAWYYYWSDQKGDAYQDRVRDESDDQPQ